MTTKKPPTTAEHVCSIIQCALDAAVTPKPEHRLVEDLGADSLDVIELVMILEEEFDIELRENEYDSVKTVADAITVVTRSLDRAQAA